MSKQPVLPAVVLLLVALVFAGLESILSAQTPAPLLAQVSLADSLYLIGESFVYILEAFVLLWMGMSRPLLNLVG